jgi:hypothetical protein
MRLASFILASVAMFALCQPSDGYSVENTVAWQTQTKQQVGNCEYSLDQAYLRHDVEWQAGAEISTTNLGSENTRCEWQISVIGSGGDVISNRDGHAANLEAGDSATRFVEVSGKFSADALQHGAWLHVHAHEGMFDGPEEQFDVPDPARDVKF